MPNRLALESSPYLRQHADNPVDWLPWGEEAFARARRDDKPIFLSVGYSTCHWCHVMAHESFENDAVAAVLNRHFVPVKVDREERPDVDRVYMTFVQATTGSGGWPMSVWLTPSLEPFYGGTYFPPTSRWGRPGFVEMLEEIARLWRDDRLRIVAAAGDIVRRLQEMTASARTSPGGRAVPGADALEAGARAYRRSFDRRHAGFGDAPKFPRPSELLFLLREHARTGDRELLDMSLATLRAMATGGMRDQIGGGFHRYAVDAQWRVPHFEKMLYDQAQIACALADAAQASGDPFWLAVADDTLAYVMRDLTHPDGGFYSAEDADSVPADQRDTPGAHATEGAFYLWTDDEIETLLGGDAEVARQRFGILPGGNAPSDPQGEFGRGNIPWLARSVAAIADATAGSADQVADALERARARLLAERATRPRPQRDDKIITAWNGLMIAGFARCARAAQPGGDDRGTRDREWIEAAERAAQFARTHLWRPEAARLFRRHRDGESAIDAYAEDYACLAWGLLELFQATGRVDWLEWALQLQRAMNALFWDEADGGWFNTTGDDPSVLLRAKDEHDGAEPAAGSVAAMNLIVLHHLTGDASLLAMIERVLVPLGDQPDARARMSPLLMSALSCWHHGVDQIAIVGPRQDPATRALDREVARRFRPFSVIVPVEPGAEQERLARHAPFVGAMTMRDGRPTAYVCRAFACDEPLTSPERLGELLDSTPAGTTGRSTREAR